MTPKSLLRHPLAVSSASELGEGRFNAVIPDEYVNPDDVKRIIFCSGKVYYDLYNHRMDEKIEDTAIVRLEQFYPFPDKDIIAVLEEYKKAARLVWCQEEPRNMGAWNFIKPRFDRITGDMTIRYEGRQASASPAAGSQKIHQAEHERLLKSAFE
jgi:multifunctional 2-oxoglutarate metabolism enzyme